MLNPALVSRIAFLYVFRTLAALTGGIFLALLTVYLVIDFVDRSKSYTGPNWVRDVAVLYGYKALAVGHQLAPAAVLLGSAAVIAVFRKRGEFTALASLAFGPRTFYVPVALFGFAVAVGLTAFEEYVAGPASRRADEITIGRFNRWADWGLYFRPKQWFRPRGADRIFQMRYGDPDIGFENVTILQVTEDFYLAERIDAAQMVSLGGTRWALRQVVERRFPADGRSTVLTYPEREYDFYAAHPGAFRVITGRPEQLRMWDLREQVRSRRSSGLPTAQLLLAMHNRFAFPLSGLAAALLVVGFALRTTRKAQLTSALVEGLLVCGILWGFMVVTRTLVLSGRLPAGVGAWTPVVVLAVAAAVLWRIRERGSLRLALRR